MLLTCPHLQVRARSSPSWSRSQKAARSYRCWNEMWRSPWRSPSGRGTCRSTWAGRRWCSYRSPSSCWWSSPLPGSSSTTSRGSDTPTRATGTRCEHGSASPAVLLSLWRQKEQHHITRAYVNEVVQKKRFIFYSIRVNTYIFSTLKLWKCVVSNVVHLCWITSPLLESVLFSACKTWITFYKLEVKTHCVSPAASWWRSEEGHQ